MKRLIYLRKRIAEKPQAKDLILLDGKSDRISYQNKTKKENWREIQ